MDGSLMLAHAAGSLVWVGGNGLLAVVAIRVRRGDDMVAIGRFADRLAFLGARVIAPAAVVVLVSGLWLVPATSDWAVSQLWVLLALGAWLLAVLLSLVFLNRGAGRLKRVSTGSVPSRPAANRALDSLLLGYGLVLITLVLALSDMAIKPGI
jgi:uncharacterized membrane protein